MAKPVKISDRNKEWAKRKEKPRPYQIRQERMRILIVCEGEKTEPNYFKSIRDTLPRHTAEVIDIHGAGFNTQAVVDEAKAQRDLQSASNAPYDEVWTVFDRDSFPPHQFDNAIHSAEAANIQVAWSNEAFEIWYVLHFVDRNTGMPRKDYQDCLSKYLNQTYRKNDRNMYGLLQEKGSEAQAVQRAEALCRTHASLPPNQANPCTTVHRLVDSLNKLRSNASAE